MNKIDILGTEYTIRLDDFNCAELQGENRSGYCNPFGKIIVVEDLETDDDWKNESAQIKKHRTRCILRPEIIHALLYESGIWANSNEIMSGWAMNEEMIDWLAIQSPKIFRAFQEADAL